MDAGFDIVMMSEGGESLKAGHRWAATPCWEVYPRKDRT